MKRSIMGLAAAAFAFTAISTISAPVMAAKSKMAKAMKCPACGMPMPMHKTATMTVPVKVGSKTYYCCAGCPAGKAHMKSNKKTM